MVAHQLEESIGEDPVETTKSLICALNYISGDLPLPPHLFAAVSSIYHAAASSSLSPRRLSAASFPACDLMGEYEDALLKQRTNCVSCSQLSELHDHRYNTHIQRHVTELEGSKSSSKYEEYRPSFTEI